MSHKIRNFFLVMFLMNSVCVLFAEYPDTKESIKMVPLGPTEAVYDIFSIGDGIQSYTAQRWITPFRMNCYETTYELWYNVRTIAEEIGYTFKNKGEGGSKGKTGAQPTKQTRYQPVTLISWYDAIIWCNALSEIEGLTPCYTYKGQVLKDATDSAKCDLAVCNWESDGYRLPTEAEWEYAARKLPDGYMAGDLISGQTTKTGALLMEEDVAWTPLNASKSHVVGTAGTPFSADQELLPGSGNANAAGIFDMGGNMLEFCWDWMSTRYSDVKAGSRATGPDYGIARVQRGGSWFEAAPFASAGDRYNYDANECYNYFGFRIVQSGR